MKKPENCTAAVLFVLLLCLLLTAEAAIAASSTSERVIIGFNKRPGSAERALLRGHKGRMRHAFRMINAFAANLPEKEISRLRANPRIKYVVEDVAVSAVEPELYEAEYGTSWGVQHIGCDLVHAQGTTGQGIKIAVIDTGIDYNHPQLMANYRGGYDFVFADNDPYDDSWNSHGTHVAGIIAATADGSGVVGGAPDASLYAVKVLDGAGSGYLSWVIAGIEWAVGNGMDIANISIAGPDSPALQDACDAAYAAGLLLVAAGGNTRSGDVLYPAAYDSVIAVSGSYQSDLPAWFSPIGAEVELMAPGVEIASTTAGGEYALLSGTSQAAPHVTAVAALLMSAGQVDVNQDGLVNNLDVRLRLQQTAVDLGDEGRDEVYGFGLVDAAAAVFADGVVDGLDLLFFARKLQDGINSISVEDFAASFGR
ncbi:MAG: S8 family peptidase [Proteobacteria bacterium]|nr:S8 family peptidase [Pseudomonadota bacterium]MBU4296337.1 S8 family peptidase [Pseudomonadota bacterium]MCG2746581.1 S8 family peptidase [Desulfobulbaceae bacterium]